MTESADRPVSDRVAMSDRLDVLAVRDELIGVSAEMEELRAQLDLIRERTEAAFARAAAAESSAAEALADARRRDDYLDEVSAALAARAARGSASASASAPLAATDLAAVPRAELERRVAELDATLRRRSVRAVLRVTRALRGS